LLVASAFARDSHFELTLPGPARGLSRLLSLAIGGMARRHPWSACYPCAIRAGSEPPGRHPPAPGSQIHRVFRRFVVNRLRLDFRTCVVPSRLSHLTVPAVDLGHSLRFRFAASCEVDDVLGLHATPDSFRSNQNPLAAYRLHQAPVSIAAASLPKPLCGRSGPAFLSSVVHRFRDRLLLPRGRPDRCYGPYDTAFDRFAPVSPGHILWSGCYPCRSKCDSTPRFRCRVPGGCTRSSVLPTSEPALSPEPLRAFPRSLDSRRRIFNLAVAQCPPGIVTRLASSRAAC